MNILQIMRAMDMGGVTTYVCRMARILVERGHKVTILAQTGTLEEAFPDGVERIICKWPGDNELIAKVALERFDLANAHNYGPSARFGARLSKELNLPYVMTVHGPRNVGHRLLFNAWSKRVIVVSEADRKNITSFGGISSDRIDVSFIGTDTNRFRPGLDVDRLREELGLPEGAPLIAHISRFDTSKIEPAFALLKALPIIWKQFPRLTALLVGSGAHFGELEVMASALNESAGWKAVHLIPARFDIPEIMNLADFVLATASTALEAMSTGVPTIASGRTGYFGIVTPENFARGQEICFGDHGRSPQRITPERLTDDLLNLLMNLVEARCDAMKNRAIIEANYSVGKMVTHLEHIYEKLHRDR